jgi:hypothetical protein
VGVDIAGARGAAALAALLLLPGLLVVRAPWTAVPFLSLFFWIASWWWLPSVARARFVGAALTAFVLAAVLRLLRFDGRRPSWPPLLALAAALLHAATSLMSAPARLETVPAQLMVWHDGLPRTYVPLRGADSFGAHPHGLDGLAADLAQLSGLGVTRAVALASAAARGLSSIGLYALLVRLSARAPAARATLGVSIGAGFLAAVGLGFAPASSVALGFVLTASGLLARSRSRSAAVGAGAFVGSAAMAAPVVVGVGIAAGVTVAALAWTRIPGEEREALRGRLLLAGAVAALTAAPFLLRVGMALP